LSADTSRLGCRDLGTIKHLVVLNAAGVAGAATLLAVSGNFDKVRLGYALLAYAVPICYLHGL